MEQGDAGGEGYKKGKARGLGGCGSARCGFEQLRLRVCGARARRDGRGVEGWLEVLLRGLRSAGAAGCGLPSADHGY